MQSWIHKILSISELRKKIFFTTLMLVICRIGAYIPVPSINGAEAIRLFRQATGGGQNLFQLVDIFSGGAFAQMTVIALGVMPYISASIIMQLLMALIPGLQREMKENSEVGKRKFGKYIRLLTVALALFQSSLFARYALSLHTSSSSIVVSSIYKIQIFGVPWLFYLIFMLTMTTGTMLLMWIGEQITEKGIGNGISLIISVGILSSLPSTIGAIVRQLNLDSQEAGHLTFISLILLFSVFVAIIIGTILMVQGQRKVPLQYARRVVGRHEVQGTNAYIPLKVNYAGVIPLIFASSLLMFPATIAQFIGKGEVMGTIVRWLTPGSLVYTSIYVMLIIFFTYFWTATQFHPEQITSDMKRSGAFIPGIRQGKPTQDFLEMTMNRVTLIGALLLAFIAILPNLVGKLLRADGAITYFFGGTSLLILVSVILETAKQVESHLLMKRYDGFIKRKKIAR